MAEFPIPFEVKSFGTQFFVKNYRHKHKIRVIRPSVATLRVVHPEGKNMLCRLSAVLLLAVSLFQPAWAEPSDLPQPSGRPILTVTGKIDVTNREGQAVFDRDLIRTLPQKRVVTETDWTEGEQVFEGPLLSDLLARVGADGAELRATALNDYRVTIPIEDAAEHDVVLALRRNGEAMRVRDKGPIWVIYPNRSAGDGPGPHNEKMIWQLRQLHVQ